MQLLLGSLFFGLGAIVASFAGVIAERLHTGQSFFSGRSRCDACGKTLSALALVPIVSFLAMGGKSSCCGAALSPRAPISEALLGGLFAFGYLTIGLGSALPFFFIAFALLLALVLYDLAHQILPPILLIPFIVASALAGFLLAPAAFLSTLFVALLISGGLALIHFFSWGRAMGFADAPLSFGLSLLAGPAAFPGLVFSFWIGAVVGIALLAGRPAGSRMGVEVPFAPFLAAGFLLAYFTQWNPFALITALPLIAF